MSTIKESCIFLFVPCSSFLIVLRRATGGTSSSFGLSKYPNECVSIVQDAREAYVLAVKHPLRGRGRRRRSTCSRDANAENSALAEVTAARDIPWHPATRVTYATMGAQGKLCHGFRNSPKSRHKSYWHNLVDGDLRCQWCPNEWMPKVKYHSNTRTLKKRCEAAKTKHFNEYGRSRRRATLRCQLCKVNLCNFCYDQFHSARISLDKETAHDAAHDASF